MCSIVAARNPFYTWSTIPHTQAGETGGSDIPRIFGRSCRWCRLAWRGWSGEVPKDQYSVCWRREARAFPIVLSFFFSLRHATKCLKFFLLVFRVDEVATPDRTGANLDKNWGLLTIVKGRWARWSRVFSDIKTAACRVNWRLALMGFRCRVGHLHWGHFSEWTLRVRCVWL